MKMNRITYSLGMLCAAMICTSCTDKQQQEKLPVSVKTLEVSAATKNITKDYVGIAESQYASSLSFQVPGQVAKVYVTKGQKVKKGQLLAILHAENLQNAYDASSASLKQAEDAYKRLEVLYRQKSLPEIKFVEIQTKLEQARSTERIAAKNLADSRLTAPFDGVIEQKSIEPGENVLPNVQAFTLLNLQGIKIKMSVPENEIAQVNIGNQAIVSVGALQGKEFTAVVSEKSMLAHPVSHNYEASMRIESTEKVDIIPGMVCKVKLRQGDEPAIVLPNNAVLVSKNGGRFVWTVRDGLVSRKNVVAGGLTESGLVITEGLSPGDRVITAGSQKVSEGMKVTEQKEL